MDLGFLNGLYYIKTESMLNEDDYNALKRLQKSFFFKYLKTRNYGYGSTYLTLDNVIKFEKKNLKESIITDMSDDFLINVFNILHDIIGIKMVYKAVKYDLELQLYSSLSSLNKESLIQFFKYGNDKLLPIELKPLFNEISKINSDDDHYVLEMIDKLTFKHYESLVLNKGKKYRPLYEYLQYQKVILNAKNFLKFRIYETDIDNFKYTMLEEKIVGIDKWEDMYQSNLTTSVERMDIYFNQRVADAFKESVELMDGSKFNEALEDYLTDKLKTLSYLDNTIGPILYYVYLKEIEALKVRGLYYDK